jgi:hypothetical protein
MGNGDPDNVSSGDFVFPLGWDVDVNDADLIRPTRATVGTSSADRDVSGGKISDREVDPVLNADRV